MIKHLKIAATPVLSHSLVQIQVTQGAEFTIPRPQEVLPGGCRVDTFPWFLLALWTRVVQT